MEKGSDGIRTGSNRPGVAPVPDLSQLNFWYNPHDIWSNQTFTLLHFKSTTWVSVPWCVFSVFRWWRGVKLHHEGPGSPGPLLHPAPQAQEQNLTLQTGTSEDQVSVTFVSLKSVKGVSVDIGLTIGLNQAMTVYKKDRWHNYSPKVKPKRLAHPLVAGCSTGHKHRLPNSFSSG